MHEGIFKKLRQSAADFSRAVWPIVRNWMGGGKLEPVEAVCAADFASSLDVLAGIDAWQTVQPGGGVRGIASRIQYLQTPYATFTVRYRRKSGAETEFEKRLRAIEDPAACWLFPKFTVQAYLDQRGGSPLYVCQADTRNLFTYIKTNRDEVEERTNPQDGTEFLVVWVPRMLDAGYAVNEYRATEDLILDPTLAEDAPELLQGSEERAVRVLRLR